MKTNIKNSNLAICYYSNKLLYNNIIDLLYIVIIYFEK